MMVDEELCNEVIRAAYGLAKGCPGVPVKVATVANGTGLDATEVAQAVEVMARDGRVATGPSPDQFTLSRFGVSVAKSHAERSSGVVFVDER